MQLKAAGSKVFWFQVFKIKCSVACLAINQVLASEAFSTSGVRQIRKGQMQSDSAYQGYEGGSVHTLIMSGVNPVYTLADSSTFVEGLKKVNFSVVFTKRR
jgi:molybdopterin-containing oxidoreductase family iron-sulfur binding subunit